MKTQTAYQEYESEGKKKIRQYKINKIQQTLNPAVFELYGPGGIFHKLVKELTTAKIVSADSDPKIAKEMEGNPDTYFGTIKEFCKETRDTFNFIDLDYCGFLSKGPRDDLQIISKIMKNEGTLFITLFHGRECYVQKGTDREDIERLNYYTIRDILAEQGILLTHKSSIKYDSIPIYKGKIKRKKKAASPMMVYEYIWKRVPKTKLRTLPRFNNRVMTLASNL